MPIRKPARLKQGDRVWVVAPASPVDTTQFRQGLDLLRAAGFEPHYREDIFAKSGEYLAGDDDRRLAELHQAFADRQTKAIFCARGGYGSLRLLDRLQTTLLKRNPKPLVGFSDNSALLAHLNSVIGQTAVYGPHIAGGLIVEGTDQPAEALWRLLSSSKSYQATLDGAVIVSAKGEGKLVGGNLSVLHGMLGLRSFPKLNGAILFLEDINEKPHKVDRMLTHMRQLGCFKRLSGLILGPLGTGNPSWEVELLREFFGSMRIPIIHGVEIGHPIPRIPLPMGVQAVLDTKRKSLKAESPVA